ncbi:Ger(x)C family spore germination protein [Bacillus shivajii]|uniref:Ger(x)C family spore germination protein n=1 Tax=Bacillus shivajii TaxID=1983719 RepID=UPI001CFB9029|nr:Ger(x)C family spore germination protein [Bacillus shivajii]UCZ53761.1 Ger(x)C family spore germination protein [Bacillus shivajii]
MRYKLVIVALISLFVLTSCWDQHLLKDARLIYGASFDLNEDNSLQTTIAIRALTPETISGTEHGSANIVLSAKGNTLRDTRIAQEKELAGQFASNKARVFILGEELAKTDLYSLLDILYRDPRFSIRALLVVTKGRGENILRLNKVQERFISEEVLGLVQEAEDKSYVSRETIQSIFPVMFDPGEDFHLPLIKKTEENQTKIVGMALFNGKKYTGKDLEGDASTVLLLLKNELGETNRFSFVIHPEEEEGRQQIVSFTVSDSNSKVNITTTNDNKVSVDIDLKLKVNIVEYPKEDIIDDAVEEITRELTEKFTEKANHVTQILQEANCDGLGIGRELMAFHPKVWKQLDWKEEYPKVNFSTTVDVEIIGTGILK